MRYYYTDPLEAAYMAREFGVRFYTDDEDVPEPDREFGWEKCRSRDKLADFEGYYSNLCEANKLLIHPDSYHIFEPIAGDWLNVSSDSMQGYHLFDDTDDYDGKSIYSKHRGSFCPVSNLKIIQRDNKPFFWPEEE